MKLSQRNKVGRRAGFTLIEIMAVVLIIGLLLGAVGPGIMKYISGGRKARIKTDIKNLESAILLYQGEHNRLPDSLEDLVSGEDGSYLNSDLVPLDPWGNEYFYDPPQGGTEYIVGTYGADGSPGGEGDDADVTNQTLKERN